MLHPYSYTPLTRHDNNELVLQLTSRDYTYCGLIITRGRSSYHFVGH